MDLDERDFFICKRIDHWIFMAKNDRTFLDAPSEGSPERYKLIHALLNAFHIMEAMNTMRFWGFLQGIEAITGYSNVTLQDILHRVWDDVRFWDDQKEEEYWGSVK